MGSRDRYTLNFKCDDCGTSGEASVSQADSRWSGPDFRVDKLPPGFLYSTASEFPQNAKFSCARCGKIIAG